MKKPGESETKPPLAVPNQLARLFRALTPYTQKEFGERTGIHRSTIGHIENGDEEPSAGHLEAMARAARTSVEAGREMLRWHESQDRPRVRAGLGVEALYARVGEEFRAAWSAPIRACCGCRRSPTASRGSTSRWRCWSWPTKPNDPRS